MKALIVRELRALRGPVIGALAVLIVSLLLALWGDYQVYFPWFYLTPLWGLALGTRGIARERARREIEFSGSWPVSRKQMWAASFLAGGVGLVGLWVLLLLIALVWRGSWPAAALAAWRNHSDDSLPIIPALALVFFGLGLLMSTIRKSPFDALGACLLGALVLLVEMGYMFVDYVPQHWGPQIGFWPLDIRSSAGGYMALAVLLFVGLSVASYFGFTRTFALQFGRRQWLTLGAGVVATAVAVALVPLGLWLFGKPGVEDIVAIGSLWGGDVSPDGEWMTFYDTTPAPVYAEDGNMTRAWPGLQRLWIVRSDGTDLRCISRWPTLVAGDWKNLRWLPFAWGPDWESWQGAGAGHWLWIWDMEHMAARKLPHPPDAPNEMGPLTVSPDGRYFIGAKILQLGDEFVKLDAQLPTQSSFVAWGEGSVYFRNDTTLWEMALPDGGLKKIASAPPGGTWSAKMSPDGRWIAWEQRAEEEANRRVVLVDRASGNVREFPATWLRNRNAWSPDGRFLWVVRKHEYSVVELTGQGRVTDIRPPSGWHWSSSPVYWSLDGKRCALGYIKGTPGTGSLGIFVADSDGADLHMVAKQTGPAATGVRGPIAGWITGNRVVILEDHKRLVAVNADTGAREVIFEAPNAGYRVLPAGEVPPASGGG